MDVHIKDVLSQCGDDFDKVRLRDKLSLDTAPFKFTRKRQVNVHDLPKNDERKLAFQALFLFVLRPKIPIKCELISTYVTQVNV